MELKRPQPRLLRTPAGFSPFRRLQSRKHGSPGFASPSTFPSQRFSRPQGFASPATLQPCFMLLPPLGLRLQSFSHSNSRDRLRPSPHLTLRRLPAARLPPGHPAAVSSATPPSRSSLTVAPPPDSRFLGCERRLLGLAPFERPYFKARRLPPPKADALLAFPPSKARHPAALPLIPPISHRSGRHMP